MRRIEQTNQFKRDFKKIAASGRYKKKDFLDVVELLIHDKPLPETNGRVAVGGYPPKAPTDPYVRTLAHTAPRYERFATLGKLNAQI